MLFRSLFNFFVENNDIFRVTAKRENEFSGADWRCCQTSANSSQNSLLRRASGSKEVAPLDESSGTAGIEIFSRVERAFLIEVVVD